jgi:hypothetical protein
MLNKEQISQLSRELKLPPNRFIGGGPIDIRCPFECLHTRQDVRATCRLWFDTHPHLYCFHEHCRERISETNLYLRLQILGTTEFPDDAIDVTSAWPPGDYHYARRIAKQFPKLLSKFMPKKWPLVPIKKTAPDFLHALGIFKRGDLIWIGNERDTGRPIHASHFHTLARWRKNPPPAHWSFTCGSAFLPGTFSRSRANVKAPRTLILESDTLPLKETAAMARWVEDEFSLPLLAFVHSGGSSLHCYFTHPGADWVATYRPALHEAGFDQSAVGLAQPMRLANQIRSDNQSVQHLLWIK